MREDAVMIGEEVKRKKKWTEKELEEAWVEEQTAELLCNWSDPPVRKSEEKEEESCSGLNNKDRILEKERIIAGLKKEMRNSEKAYREMIEKLEEEIVQLRWEKEKWALEREE